jgi:hypothetical protein
MEGKKTIDWDIWRLRCHAIGYVMGQPKLKADKDAGNLSATAKSFLLKEYIRIKYGRKYDIKSKYIKKGLAVEEDNITLYSRLKKRFFKKNTDRLANDFIEGEPDLFEGEDILNALLIIDVKSSWDIFTFYDSVMDMVTDGINPDYQFQLLGYMALTGAKGAKLAYGLINTPDALVDKEKSSLLFELGGYLAITGNDEKEAVYNDGCAAIEHRMKYDDIPIEERLIEIHIDRNEEHIEQIYRKVEKCREYLKHLDATLTPAILASFGLKKV